VPVWRGAERYEINGMREMGKKVRRTKKKNKKC